MWPVTFIAESSPDSADSIERWLICIVPTG